MTTLAKQYIHRLHELPCVLCVELGMQQTAPTAAHHTRHGAGMGQRAPDWLACALCYDCHQGPQGLHGDRSRFKQAKWDEMDALAATNEAMWRVYG